MHKNCLNKNSITFYFFLYFFFNFICNFMSLYEASNNKESIMKTLIFSVLLIVTVGFTGCSSSIEPSNVASSKFFESKKDKRSWCEKNYSSASASMRDRQSNAKHCDVRARQAYTEAKENEVNKDDEK
jgi:hypothetical protein